MEEGANKGWMYRFARVEPGEQRALLLSGGCFFFLMFGYFLLRPLREAMGVQRSMKDLQTLFLITCGVSLLVSLAFGGLVSRVDRKRFISIAYRSIMACLAVFVILMSIDAGEQFRLYTDYVFYVWLSVVNLFIVSVFWGMMADAWTLEQSKRLFAVIGIGGTLGAVLGSNFVWWLAKKIDPALQMVIAIVMFEMAVQCMKQISRRSNNQHEIASLSNGPKTCDASKEPIGGVWWDGVKAVVQSPYLLGIGLYIILLAVSNTLIYFTGSELVSRETEELSSRVALFAQLDMWTQLATLMVQLFVTRHLIQRLGIGITLAMLPIVTVVGFALLAWVEQRPGVEPWQIFGVFAAFNAIHRATRYAIVRPARETLFSVLPAEEKFKAKPIIDVFVYRGGDVAGAGIERYIAGSIGGLAAMAMFVAPMAMLWGGLSIALAVAQNRRANEQEEMNESTPRHQSPTTTEK